MIRYVIVLQYVNVADKSSFDGFEKSKFILLIQFFFVCL